MTYSPLDLLLNGNFLQSVQAVNSCNGHLSTITSDFPTWWTGNSAIATASGHQINGVGVGSTNHYAQSINMYWGPLEDDPSCPLSQEQPSADTEVKPVISGSNTLWWFKGLGGGVSGYPNQITLTASSGGLGTSFAWAIASGSDKVSLSTSTSATIQVTSKGQSTTANDVGITVTVGGITSDPFKLTIRAPYTLGSSPDHPVPVYSADPTFVWNVQIWYRVLDNFLSPLPNPVPINENWTSAIVHDYLNENWRRGDPGCANLDSTATFFDLIAGETSDHSPAPTYNQQQNGSAVQHWGQEWRLGTCMIGSGPRVQTDTIQKYTDHAAHTGITSPAP
jgi:hypothetical protein